MAAFSNLKWKVRWLQLITAFVAIFLMPFFSATGQELLWDKYLGGHGEDNIEVIKETSGESLFIAGHTMNPENSSTHATNKEFWLIKLRQGGKKIWEETYGGSFLDQAKDMTITADGGCILTGQTISNGGDVSDNNGLSDIWVVKVDSSGGIQWENTYGSTLNDGAEAILKTRDDGYIITGYSSLGDQDVSSNYGKTDVWVLKLSRKGKIQWKSTYGGPKVDLAEAIVQDEDGEYIMAGHTASDSLDVTKNKGKTDGWLIKIGNRGTIQWKKTFGGKGKDQLNTLKVLPDKSLLAGGTKNGYAWLLKIDSNGSMKREMHYKNEPKANIQSLEIDQAQNLVLCGKSFPKKNNKPKGWIANANGSGKILWDRNYGNKMPNGFQDIALLKKNHYLAIGYSAFSDTEEDYTYQKKDGWAIRVGPCKKAVTATDTVKACNRFTVPSGDETYTKSGSYKDTIPARDKTNQYCDSIVTYEVSINPINDSVIKEGDKLKAQERKANYQWGRCRSSFEPIKGETSRTFTPDCDGYYALKITDQCSAISDCLKVGYPPGSDKPLKAKEYSLDPRPVEEILYITFNSPLKDATIKLKDITEKVIEEKKVKEGLRFRFNTAKLLNGPHFLEIKEGGQTIRKRLKKQ